MKPSYNIRRGETKKPASAGAKRSYTKRDDKPAFSKDSPPKRNYTKRDDKPAYNDRGGEKRSYVKRDDKSAYSDRGGEKRSYVKRDDTPAYNDRGGEKRSYVKRDDKPAYNDRGGEKRSYVKRDDKPAYNDRGGEKRGYVKRDDKPAYNDRGGEKRGYAKRDDKPAYNDRGGEKRSYAKRDDYNAQNAEKRISSKRGPDYNGEKSKTKPANDNHESRSYERKPRSYDKADSRNPQPTTGNSSERKPGSYNREPKVDNRQQSYDKRNPKGEKRYEAKDERRPISKNSDDRKSYTTDKQPISDNRQPTSFDNREKRHENKPYDNSRTYDKPNYSKAPKAKQPKGEDEVRLNRYLSNAGIASRRDADKFISAGLVKVNGKVVTEMGVKVKSTDEVIYNNEKLSGEKKVYFLMNKPKDYITTNDDPQGRKTVLDLVKNFSRERVFPVGRLDRNTTGTLLLTNDGDIAQRLSHPKFGVKKVYKVGLDKNITPAILKQLRDGIELEDGSVQPDVVDYMDPVDKKIVGVEIHSGRNRIVRRMFESVGYEVIRLDRLVFAGLDKKGLKRGEVRHLTEKEVSQLRGL